MKDDSSLKYHAGEKSWSPPPRSSQRSPVTVAPSSSPVTRIGQSAGSYSFGYSPKPSRAKKSTQDTPEWSESLGPNAAESPGRWRPKTKYPSKIRPPTGDSKTKKESYRKLEKQYSSPEPVETAIADEFPESSHDRVLKQSISNEERTSTTIRKPIIVPFDFESVAPGPEHVVSPQGVVLKVKDGPMVHYKPSDTMLSDTSPHWSNNNMDDSQIYIYNPDERPLPALKNRKNSNTYDYSPTDKIATPPPIEDSTPVIVQPTTINQTIKSLVDNRQSDHAASSPIDNQPAEAEKCFPVVEPKILPRINHDDIVVGPHSSSSSSSRFGYGDPDSWDQYSVPFRASTNFQSISDETAFCSPSLIFQQKAGIRHDDMVVGPVSRIQMSDTQFLGGNVSDGQHNNVEVDTVNSYSVASIGCSLDVQSDHDRNDISRSAVAPQTISDSPPKCHIIDAFEDMVNNGRVTEASDYPASHSHNITSNPSNKSVSKMKGVERKRRGGSPGSGIPVRRGGGSGSAGATERFQERSRDSSPREEFITSPKRSEAFDLDDSNYGRSQSLPARSAHQKWRPKDKTSGTHRTPDSVRRVKNVSTESGYATDHAICSDLGDARKGFSPDHEKEPGNKATVQASAVHGSLDRQPRQSRMRQIPSSPLSRLKQRKKSLETSASSKGQPLSNIPIPVPMCHDERTRKPVVRARPPTPSNTEMPSRNDSPSNNTIAESPKRGGDFTDRLASQDSPPSTTSSTPEPWEPRAGGHFVKRTPAKGRILAPSLPPSSHQSSSTISLPAASATAVPVAPATTSHPASQSSTADLALKMLTKERLHRSAEHLLPGTKLTVYRGPDNNDQPDSASDISVATACSLPVKAMEGTRAHLPDDISQKMQVKAQSTDVLVDRRGKGLPKRSQPKGRCVSLLRREKERSTAIIRRGSDRAVTVDRNDPSAADLKSATSLKELCQSMASLLNIGE